MDLEKASQILKETQLEETLKTIKTNPIETSNSKVNNQSLKKVPKLSLKIHK